MRYRRKNIEQLLIDEVRQKVEPQTLLGLFVAGLSAGNLSDSDWTICTEILEQHVT